MKKLDRIIANYPAWVLASMFILLNLSDIKGSLHGLWGGALGDPVIYLFIAKHVSLNFFSPSYELPMLEPFGRTLAYSDNFFLPAYCISILHSLGLSLELSFNIIILFARFLNGVATYFLSKSIGLSSRGALIAGVCFMNSCFFFSQWTHPQMQFAFWLPWCWVALDRAVIRKSTLYAFLSGLILLGAFFSSAYYFIFSVILAVILSLLHFKDIISSPRFVCTGLLINLPAIGLLWLNAEPYLEVASVFGERSLYEAKKHAGGFFSLLSADPGSMLWSKFLSGIGMYEARFFPGIIALSCATVGIFHKSKLMFGHLSLIACTAVLVSIGVFSSHVLDLVLFIIVSFTLFNLKKSIWFQVFLIGVLFYWLSLGITGSHSLESLHTELFYFVHQYMPGVGAIRASGRLGVVALLVVCLFAGRAVEIMRQVPISLFLLVLIPDTLHSPTFVSHPDPSCEALVQLAKRKTQGVFAVLPVPQKTEQLIYQQTKIMNQVISGPPFLMAQKSMINGYSGILPRFNADQFSEKTLGFPSDTGIDYLGRVAGLDYLVILPEYEKAFRRLHAEFKNELIIEYAGTDGSLLVSFNPLVRLSSAELYISSPSPFESLSLEFHGLERGQKVNIVDSLGAQLASVVGGQREEVVFDLPITGSRVRPLKIRFIGEHLDGVYVRRKLLLPNIHTESRM